jgi:hypothetical protein
MWDKMFQNADWSQPKADTLGLISVKKEILWLWTKYIKGKCKKYTLNENLSMVMYALVHKL